MSATLHLPNIQYRHSFLEAVKEYQAEGRYTDLDPAWLEENFTLYVNQLERESKGLDLKPGYVPHTTFWLIDNDEFIGRVDIRHEFNDALLKEGGSIGYDIRPTKRKQGYGKLILELGLKKAKEMGLPKVLITCDVNNVGSNKIIQANGGVLEKVIPMKDGKPDKVHYWFDMKNQK